MEKKEILKDGNYHETIDDQDAVDILNNIVVELTGLKYIIFEVMKNGLQENKENLNCISSSWQTSLDVCIQRLKYATEQLKGNKRND